MRLLAALLLLASALAQEYRALPGADTGLAHLDRSYALVYPAERPRAVLLFMPGLLGGSTNFALLAERLKALDPSLEVWAWERRANGLEDRQGFLQADPLAYYRNLQAPDLSPLRAWGLEVHLRDLDLAVEEARKRGPVVLLGHSLGASLATLYAWLHGEKLEGLVLLDGSLGLVQVSREAFLEGQDTPFGRLPGLKALLAGEASPVFGAFLTPKDLALAEAEAYLAARRPEEPVPFGPYRATREALALLQVDDHYSLFPVFSVSAGRAWAREGLSLLGLLQGRLVLTVRGPRDGLVRWRDTGEATDPRAFLRAYARPRPAFPSGISPTGFFWRSAATPTSSRALSPGPSPTRSWPWGRGGAFSPIPKASAWGRSSPAPPQRPRSSPASPTWTSSPSGRTGRPGRFWRTCGGLGFRGLP
jgi:pimeloyl-ACP methyl ester carboxylesterase